MRSRDELAADIKVRVARDNMGVVREYLGESLKEAIQSMISADDTQTLLRQQGFVRGLQESIRLLGTIYVERRKA